MKNLVRGLCVILLTTGISSVSFAIGTDSTALIVSTKQGQLRGIAADSIYAWKGIPYAKAPVGDLRFRAPQPPVSWQGVRDASKTGL